MALSAKQARFVDEYLVDLNATEAAKRAGYSERSAHVQGSRLLENASVSRAIRERQADRAERTEIDQDWVIDRLVRVTERCMQAEPVMDKRGDQVETETPDGERAKAFMFDSKGANGALQLLGRHLGMFNDKLDVNMSGDLSTRLQKARQRDNGSE